jgi:hypothetical protein
MIKRILTLVVTSSIISAGLLYLGFTMMERYSPALASSLNALVAGTNTQASPKVIAAAENFPLAEDLSSSDMDPGSSSLPKSAPNIQVDSNPSLKTSANSISAEKSGPGVTISQLMNNPDQYRNQAVTISGIATSMGDDKVLVNDGTGQILFEVDDELVDFAIINGLTITIVGMLDDSCSSAVFELDACTLDYQNNIVVIDDCIDDDDTNDDDINDDDDLDDDDDDGLDDDDHDDDDDDDDVDDDVDDDADNDHDEDDSDDDD